MPDGTESEGVVIGVDLGGTKVAAGLVDPLAGSPPGTQTIHGIGICSPGPLDPRTGVVINPPNLPCWRNFPPASETTRMYRLPVQVDNDANAGGSDCRKEKSVLQVSV